MDCRIAIAIVLSCHLFALSGCLKVEDRFDHRALGTSLRINSVEFTDRQGGRFVLSAQELALLEREMGKLRRFTDYMGDHTHRLFVSAKCGFSDGATYDVSVLFFCARPVLEFQLPGDAGFQGAIPVLVRLDKVLSAERLEELYLTFLDEEQLKQNGEAAAATSD